MLSYLKLNIVFCLVIFSAQSVVKAQHKPAESGSSYVTIIPGEEYQAGSFHRLFFGDQWRDIWATEIKVKVLNLRTFAGGLTPENTAGEMQTLSLKLKGNDGNEYRFRTINKTGVKIISDEWLQTPVEIFLRDQISSSNPAALLIASPLLNAAGAIQTQPLLYVMPDDEKLGSFRRNFAGMAGILQLIPDEYETNPNKAEVVKDTYTMFDELERDNNNEVNKVEFLKARLMDVFLNDWDRHVGQWNWAAYKQDERIVWSPLPKDRDQAFARFGGVIPYLATYFIKQLHSFGPDYYEMEDLIYSARFLDRRLLVSFSKNVWDSLAVLLQNKLTDSVITEAVNQMPAEMFAKEGENMISDLKSRRDKLESAANEYYELLSEYVTINLSNSSESAEIIRQGDSVDVIVYDTDDALSKREIFHRKFYRDETEEIRLLMNGGNDTAIVKGETRSSINVIISAGEGKNLLVDSSNVRGKFLGIFPFSKSVTGLYIMDSNTTVSYGESSYLSFEEKPVYPSDTVKYEPEARNYGYEWTWVPWVALNSNDGLIIGGGRNIYKYGYNTYPYLYSLLFKGAYATESRRFRADVQGEFYTLSKHFIPSIKFEITGLNIMNYYGAGNTTPMERELEDEGFYDVKQQQIILTPFVKVPLSSHNFFMVGTSLKLAQTEKPENSFIAITHPYGSEDILRHSIFINYVSDTRNEFVTPYEGHLVNVGVSFFPGYTNTNPQFTKLLAAFNYYFSLSSYNISSLAFRAGGEKLWGKYPFHESAFVGGQESLRGFQTNRYAGDASLYAGSELRLMVTHFFALVPIQLGFNLFAETGRVFLTGEQSSYWHNTYGFGLLFSLVQRDFTFNFSIALSGEDTEYYFTTGFPF